ncbi:hypothetical protein BDY21DRAFT_371326 [Lineolata rhizophorae]|uniref:Uncharacterized protein n=1 Tax=Lineolata rhizophorae TaxID=578093 RepID=A0A6A6P173_9PEZI|nr:hypothetical protein BDY21DRAFT_371326 [Lineolata rhizophorae]
MEEADLTVIGAGWSGLAAAKTYMEFHGSAKVVVLDNASSIGGVWAKERLFPCLWSNNLFGTYCYSDYPMDGAKYGVSPGQHIPGTVVHAYLNDYAAHFGVDRVTRLCSSVVAVEEAAEKNSWDLTVRRDDDDIEKGEYKLRSKKLIIATGLTSEPFLPALPGADSFGKPMLHSRDFGSHSSELTSSKAKSVAVFGGGKSAWDHAYGCATAPNGPEEVHMIIRSSGHGPCFMSYPFVTPLRKQLEKLVFTRCISWMSPCAWGEQTGYAGLIRRALHGTFMGRWVVDAFWKILEADVLHANGYDKHPEMAKLRPKAKPFWCGTFVSMLNYPTDFFELVRNGKIKVHVADITRISPGTLHLSDGTTVPVDALVCATGWKHKPPINFVPASLGPELGMPHRTDQYASLASSPISPGSAAAASPTSPSSPSSARLDPLADAAVLRRFPRLAQPPSSQTSVPHLKDADRADQAERLDRGFALYRFMAPPARLRSRNIGFAGMLKSFGTPIVAQTQALWLTLLFDGRLEIPGEQSRSAAGPPSGGEELDKAEGGLGEGRQIASEKSAAEWEAALNSRFMKWRAPAGFGAYFPDMVFEILPYIDRLMEDLGLEKRRKKGVLKEVFEPYSVNDYVGLNEEWKRVHGNEAIAKGM